MNEADNSDMNACLAGHKLYGNDFDQSRIDEWFADEAEGYCALPIWAKAYHARNTLEKFRPTAVYYVLRKPLSVERGQ